jgi:hypothetical protein
MSARALAGIGVACLVASTTSGYFMPRIVPVPWCFVVSTAWGVFIGVAYAKWLVIPWIKRELER